MTQVTGDDGDNQVSCQLLLSHTPITCAEMKALLEPLQWSLQRVESTLLDLTESAWPGPEELAGADSPWRQELESSHTSPRQQELHTSSGKNPTSSKLTAKNEINSRLAADLVTTGQSKTDDKTNGPACSPSASSAQSGLQPQLFLESQSPLIQEPLHTAEENLSLAVTSQCNDKDDMRVPVEDSAVEDFRQKQFKHDSFCSDICDEDGEADQNNTGALMDQIHVNKLLLENTFSQGLTAMDLLAVKLERFINYWNNLEEPKRASRFAQFVTSKKFETFVMTVIMLNSILVAYTLDWQVRNLGASSEPLLLDVLEKICLFIFTVELILRLITHRLYFFINNSMHWNIMDFILVSISVFSFVMESLVKVDSDSSNVGFMRVLRLLKLARIFRSVRSFRFFKSLELLLISFQRSCASLFWGLVMLAFVLYTFSLIFMQAVMDYLSSNDDLDPVTRQKAIRNFGSLGDTLLSLYMAVTGGDDWSEYYDTLASAGTVYGLLMVFFTFFFLFALFNILTGSLVEKAMATSKPERTDMILHQRKEIVEEKKQFIEVCKSMDSDGSGKISWKEFQTWMSNPVMLAYMASIGIHIHDVELFFETVGAREGKNAKTVNTGEITIEHFAEGCMHMKGTATALDMQRQLFEMHIMQQDLNDLGTTFARRMQQLENLENLMMQLLEQKRDRYGLVSFQKAEQRHGGTNRNLLSI